MNSSLEGVKVATTALAILCAGCSMEGKLDAKDLNKVMACMDLRNGETFTFNTNTVRDIRVGLAGSPTVALVTDATGKVRRISSEMDAYLKCQPA